MYRVLLVALVAVLSAAQLEIDGHMLVVNSSFNRGVVVMSMSYTGSQPYNMTILQEHLIEFDPAAEGIDMKHEGKLNVSSFFTNRDENGYWITIKILDRPQYEFEDFLLGAINGHPVLFPTMKFPLHMLNSPLQPSSGEVVQGVAVFQVNYEGKRSIVAYGGRILQPVVFHWGNSRSSQATKLEAEGAQCVHWDEKSQSYVPESNSWGKGWQVSMTKATFAKAVRPPAAEEPSEISVVFDEKLRIYHANHNSFTSSTNVQASRLQASLLEQLRVGSEQL